MIDKALKASSIKELIDLLLFVTIENKNQLPYKSGIYFVFEDNEILYVGKSINLHERWQSHQHYNRFKKTDKIGFVLTDNLLIEKDFIRKYQPKFNKLFYDNQNRVSISLKLEADVLFKFKLICMFKRITMQEYLESCIDKLIDKNKHLVEHLEPEEK